MESLFSVPSTLNELLCGIQPELHFSGFQLGCIQGEPGYI